MMKRILAITLFSVCLFLAGQAEARLTLGVAAGSAEAVGVSPDQTHSLARLIAEKLGEEVVVKDLGDADALINWLDRFAAIDLALLSDRDIKAYRGRFMMIGPLDPEGSLNLVGRQGGRGDLPQRLGNLVNEEGLTVWRSRLRLAPAEEPSLAKTPDKQTTTQKEISAAPAERETVLRATPPVASEAAVRTSPGEKTRAGSETVAAVQPVVKSLVLGVMPGPQGLLKNKAQAEELAAYLENSLPADVAVKEFTEIDNFVAWFMRYRMVDIAVIPPGVAEANFGPEYKPLAKLFRSVVPGEESTELIVMRHGQDVALQALLQQAILDLPKDPAGKQLMATLNISGAMTPGFEGRQPLDLLAEDPVAEVPATEETITPPPLPEAPAVIKIPAEEKPAQIVEPGPESLEDVIAKALEEPEPEYPEPVRPVAPAEVAIVAAPAVEEFTRPLGVPSLPAVHDTPVVPPAVPAPADPPVVDVIAKAERPELAVPSPAPGLAEPPAAPTVDEAQESEPQPVVVLAAPPVLPDLPQVPGDVEMALQVPAKVSLPEAPEILAVPSAPQIVETAEVPVPEPEPVAVVEPPADVAPAPPVVAEEAAREDLAILEEVLKFADPVPSHELKEQIIILGDGDAEPVKEEDLLAMLGEDPVASMVAQPDIPQELRPTGVPIVRPGRVSAQSSVVEEELLVASLPEPLRLGDTPKPPILLPQPEPEPNIIYVVPFVSVMVPPDVSSRIFDRFVDSLIEEGEALGLQFLILKEGLQRVSPEWLAVRKYVTGEIYAYVEDSGCCSTDLRSKARMSYRVPNQHEPAFGFEYPVRSFFDHDRSTIEIERTRLADDVAGTLANEFVKSLKN